MELLFGIAEVLEFVKIMFRYIVKNKIDTKILFFNNSYKTKHLKSYQ